MGIPFVNTSGSGSGGTANVTVAGGVVTAVAIGGSTGGGYTTSDVLTFNGDDLSVTTVDGLSIASAGSGYANGTFNGVTLNAGSGTGLIADLTFSGNALTGAVITAPGGQGINYLVGDTVSFLAGDVGGNTAGLIENLTITQQGTGFTDGVYTGVALTGGNGSSGTVDIDVTGGYIASATINNKGTGYQVGDTLGVTCLLYTSDAADE